MTEAPYVFKLVRVFDAPTDKVWAAWTDAEKLAKWFSPKGVKTVHSKLDLRSGGSYHYGLENPDGSRYWGRWIIVDVKPKTELVFIVSFSNEKMEITHHPKAPTWPAEMHSIVRFTPQGAKTEVEVQWTPHNASAKEIKAFEAGAAGMTEGWGGTFDQLAGYLAM